MRRLKQRLIDYTTLQVPGTSKPFQLHADVSGYAVGAVLEQKGQRIGFLQQLKASGRTALWLDFLAEFPDLTIIYVPGARNQVADVLLRIPETSSSHSSPPRPRAPTRRQDIIASVVPADDQVVLPPRTR